MGELHRKGWKTAYEFCTNFGNECIKNKIEILEKDVADVYKGNNLYFSKEESDGEKIMIYKNFPVAIGKLQKGKWKNQIPRVLLRNLKV